MRTVSIPVGKSTLTLNVDDEHDCVNPDADTPDNLISYDGARILAAFLVHVGVATSHFPDAPDTIELTDDEKIELLSLLEDANESSYEDEIEIGARTYLSADDSDAARLWEDHIESYIDDVVLPELPECYQRYFDSERFKRDCLMDGRGHELARYDGNEHEINICGTTFYVYRVD